MIIYSRSDELRYTHGLSDSRLYSIWANMKTRCYNPNSNWYKDYGARGITVCDEWRNDFQTFYDWAMNNGYKEKLTLDRIDNDGNYEPSNCRWATSKEQCRNRSSTRLIKYGNEIHSIKDWSEITGIPYDTLRMRISTYHWPVEKALTKGASYWDQKNSLRLKSKTI